LAQHTLEFGKIIKSVLFEWRKDNASHLAAALAFYAVFSLAPLLIIGITIAGFVFGEQVAHQEVFLELQDLIGSAGTELLSSIVQSVQSPSASITATVIGIITILIGASSVFRHLKDSMDIIWEVESTKSETWKDFFMTQFLSFFMVLSVGVLLLIFVFLSILMTAFYGFFLEISPWLSYFLVVGDLLVFFFVFTLMFAVIFKILPNVKTEWQDVWIGATLTSFLFTLGRFVIGIYLGYSSVVSIYGAAGSFVVILLWIYYSAHIFLLGAEFTQVYASQYGSYFLKNKTHTQLTIGQKVGMGVMAAGVLATTLSSYVWKKWRKK